MNEKIWCGKGKQSNFGIRVSICLDDIPAEHITASANGKRYVSIDVNEKRGGADQWGNTHGVSVNTWKPNQESKPKQTGFESGNELPF